MMWCLVRVAVVCVVRFERLPVVARRVDDVAPRCTTGSKDAASGFEGGDTFTNMVGSEAISD